MGSDTHTVYRLAKRGAIDTLQPHTEPIPQIDKYEVLVRVRAVTLNYRDIAISMGKPYPAPVKDNLVPCSDAAGEVVEVGSEVSGLKKGDYVVGNFDLAHMFGPQRDMNHAQGGPIDGTLRQYIVYPGVALVKIPKKTKMTFPEMASLVCAGVTAWNALYGNVPLKPGQTVLFQGTGGVSLAGLVLAKAAGAVTIITSSSDEKLALVQKEYGADYAINYRKTPNWAEETNRVTEGRGVDLVFDNAGGSGIKQSLECIAFGGTIACIGFLSTEKADMPDVGLMALFKGCIVRGILVGGKELLEDLVTFVANKDVHIPVSKTFGFSKDEVLAAFNHVSRGDHMGKVGIMVD